MSKVVRLSDATLEVLDEFRCLIIHNLEEEINDNITSETYKGILKNDIERYRTDDNYLISLAFITALNYHKNGI